MKTKVKAFTLVHAVGYESHKHVSSTAVDCPKTELSRDITTKWSIEARCSCMYSIVNVQVVIIITAAEDVRMPVSSISNVLFTIPSAILLFASVLILQLHTVLGKYGIPRSSLVGTYWC